MSGFLALMATLRDVGLGKVGGDLEVAVNEIAKIKVQKLGRVLELLNWPAGGPCDVLQASARMSKMSYRSWFSTALDLAASSLTLFFCSRALSQVLSASFWKCWVSNFWVRSCERRRI
ncbi:hypothetical protein PanWU01x14_081330 [Parasponia andersonii]|uniref:Uncharacterized protein n=1 Tax=Parasponia andersonii TaxID=3476 RepID=A0A2P5DB01_PARAD|nr:hypothetical protein PanWU01x14_081330 [Parasponia andersonii]